MLYAASLEVAQGNAVQYSSKDIANLLGAAAESLAAELERADLAEADANDAALQLRYVEDKQAATAEALARTRRDPLAVYCPAVSSTSRSRRLGEARKL